MSILLTKVRQPQRRKDILRRVRLVDTIHQNIHRKLTFVSAPAGFGKTTLLIDFASDIEANVCWYLIGPEEKSLAEFVRHIVAAFQQEFDQFGEDLEKSLSLSDDSVNANSLAIDLINEVETRIDDFTVLVLDDYHLAGENPEIVEFVEKLIEHLPDQLRILIGSRSVYGIPTANLYIRDELVTISADELRFRADELQRLVLQNYQIRLPDEQAEDFARQSDGWIVAILLALRAMDSQGSIPKLIGGTERIYEYLAEEVVNRQSPELRDFMYCTSILGDFNEDLVNTVRQKKDSAKFLKLLEDRNLFVTRTEGVEGISFRYHQLFSEFLQQQFQKHDSARMRQMQERAAEWFRDTGDWESAIQHKLSSGDISEAALWMDEISDRLFISGRHSTISRWYFVLEKARGKRKLAPKLVLYEAKILGNKGAYEQSDKLLSFCEPLLREKEDIVALANVLVTRGMLLLFKKNYDKANSLSDEALSLLGHTKGGKAKTHQKQQAERLKALSSHYNGNSKEAALLLQDSGKRLRKLVEKSNGTERKRFQMDLAELLTDHGLISLDLGDLLSAKQSFQEVLKLVEENRGNHTGLAMAYNNIAYSYYLTGEFDQSWKAYERALQFVQNSNRLSIFAGILTGRGDVLLATDRISEARKSYMEALEISKKTKEAREAEISYKGLTAVERKSGNHSQAMTYLRESAIAGGYTTLSPHYCLQLGEIYLEMGQLGLAQSEFEKVLNSDDKSLLEERALAAFLIFRILVKEENFEQARNFLDISMNASAKLGYDQFLVEAARPMQESIDIQLEKFDSPQLADILSRARKSILSINMISDDKANGESPDFTLEVHSFGKGEVILNGEPLSSSAWQSSRSKALFYYIIDNKQVLKDDVGLEFWPNFSPGKMSSNFHATLWRVRKALGHKNSIIFENDNYQLNPNITLWSDTSEFEELAEKSSIQSIPEVERVELLLNAANLYKDDFLTHTFVPWADRRRHSLQKQFIEILNKLAEIELSRKQFKKASKYLAQILAIDPYKDNIHLSLMNCFVSIGNPSAAKAHFVEYEDMLRKELNAEPILELREFFDQISV